MRLAMPRPIPVLSSELVTLRAPDPPRDAADFRRMNADPQMHLWTGNRVLGSQEEAEVELARYAAMTESSTWMIVDNESSRVVGRFFLELEEREGLRIVGEGNRIARPYWRRGHNRAARALMFTYAFGELRADRIETWAWAGNTSSTLSIEAHGFRHERDVSQWNEKHGAHNVIVYRGGDDLVFGAEVGMQVQAPFEDLGEVVCSRTPAGKAATAVHLGAYSSLNETHRAIGEWCEKHGHIPAGVNWEVYGDWTGDEAKLRTDVFWLLR
jgi:RimJ/RimL family protein N-acetyltransferase